MNALRHVAHLGFKELISLRHDPVLILFIIYAFTLDIVTAVDQSVQVRNAAVAIVDEDRSQLTRRIAQAFFPPHFQTPAMITLDEADQRLHPGMMVEVRIDVGER